MFAIIKNWEINCISKDKIKWEECIDIWEYNYKITYIYKDWNIIIDNSYLKNEINEEFNNTINQLTAWYSQAEIDSWNEKQAEAHKVLLWETSDFLNNLCIEWETVEDLANKIIKNAWLFKTAYANAEKTKRQKLKYLNKKNNS